MVYFWYSLSVGNSKYNSILAKTESLWWDVSTVSSLNLKFRDKMTSVLSIVTIVLLIHLSLEIGRCSTATNDYKTYNELMLDIIKEQRKIAERSRPLADQFDFIRTTKENAQPRIPTRIELVSLCFLLQLAMFQYLNFFSYGGTMQILFMMGVVGWLFKRCCCGQKNHHKSGKLKVWRCLCSQHSKAIRFQFPFN